MHRLAVDRSKGDFYCAFSWLIAAQGGASWSIRANDLINVYLIFYALKFQKCLT